MSEDRPYRYFSAGQMDSVRIKLHRNIKTYRSKAKHAYRADTQRGYLNEVKRQEARLADLEKEYKRRFLS